MSDVNMLFAALAYISIGLPIFPVHCPLVGGGCSCRDISCESIGKHPATRHGFKDATTNRTSIEEWWTRWPSANIGMPTGSTSGVIVLDTDFRSGGRESLEALEKKIGVLPPTLVSITGNGLHYFFKCSGLQFKSGAGVLGPGLDIRAEGGFVVVPPSLHKSGKRYQWKRGEMDGGR